MKVEFCTCGDLDCPNHPNNHDQGCTPCILKNLNEGEIPSCFFNVADPERKREGYFFENFAKVVLDK